MLVGRLNAREVLHGQAHRVVIDLVHQNNVAARVEGAVGAHGNKVFIVLFNGRNRLRSASSPVVCVQVPENGRQVQLGGNPTHTVIHIAESLSIRNR